LFIHLNFTSNTSREKLVARSIQKLEVKIDEKYSQEYDRELFIQKLGRKAG